MKNNDLCKTPVIQARVKAGMTAGELVEQFGKSRAYNAGSLWHAVNIYEKMLSDPEVVKFFGLAGAMVPGVLHAGGILVTINLVLIFFVFHFAISGVAIFFYRLGSLPAYVLFGHLPASCFSCCFSY